MLITVLILACVSNKDEVKMEKWKQEIVQTEKEFEKMVNDEGIEKGFTFFAADNAAMIRDENIISGKDQFREYFKSPFWGKVKKLEWTPDYVDVSSSGDLGYTYGNYQIEYLDQNNKTVKNNGVFRTIWKRQNDGSWKFVLD